MKQKKIKLVLCWHMHQPHYRDGLDGDYRLPWVYLHGIKDYTDMVAHLEDCPEAKVVINFAPILLEQLDDYTLQMRSWLQGDGGLKDPLLRWVSGEGGNKKQIKHRLQVVESCQKAFAPTMIEPFPAFKALIAMTRCDKSTTVEQASCLGYFNKQFFTDLLMWYHLVWMGQSLRLNDSRIQNLINKGNNRIHFSERDQRILMEVMAEAVEGIIPRYRALMARGQIEISMTPYGHPIVPLLIDFNSMKEVMPDAPLPQSASYPDGYERAKWHIDKGLEVFKKYFDIKPKGVWLSEGALSSAAVGLLEEYGIKWTASGESVWRNSCEVSQLNPHDVASKKALYQPLQHASNHCALFFRDDGLSDLIGFQYKDWDPEDAANDFVYNLRNIANFLGDEVEDHVVSVILDGENAWEYYADNAYYFLKALYDKLSVDDRIEMTTFSKVLEDGMQLRHLPVIKSGSWVHGSFSTWIGDKDKNAAWDLLVEAKQAYDQVVAFDELSQEEILLATEQLAICEGSDWFWWFGDYNPSSSVRDFDQLYRRHLEKLYQLLGKRPPEQLKTPLSSGGGEMDSGGVMQRGEG